MSEQVSIEADEKSITVKLKLDDDLSKVRTNLEEKKIYVDMNIYIFAMKVLKSQQNVNDKGEKPAETITSAGLSDIPREDEKNYKLEEVIEITVNNNASRKTNILYLKKEPKPNLKILSL